MKKNILYRIMVILAILAIIIINSNMVFAKINRNITISDKLMYEVAPVGNSLVGALQVIGVFISIGMTMVVGIKYMLSSVDEKAEYKKTAIAYLTGAALIFISTQLVEWIYDLFN